LHNHQDLNGDGVGYDDLTTEKGDLSGLAAPKRRVAMKDLRVFNEAQRAKEAASSKARELADRASNSTEDLRGKASELKAQIAEQAAGMGEMSLAKLDEMLAEFNEMLPVLRAAGYTLRNVEIELGLPPKLIANFLGSGGVVPELPNEGTERALTVLLLKSIHQVTKLQSSITIKGLRPSGLTVEIGLVPRIVVTFTPV
jgi:hypothetical protein